MEAFNKTNLRNIKGIFQAKTGVDPNRGRACARPALRRGAALLIAAAVLLCAAGAAWALFGGGWLQDFFSDKVSEPLSTGQEQFIREKMVGIGQSVTSDGCAVTVDSAICDEKTLYVVIRIEGPEGVRLDMTGDAGSSLFFGVAQCSSTGVYTRTGHLLSAGCTWFPMEDGDGLANTATLVMRKTLEYSQDSNQGFTDGEPWRLELGELSVREGPYFSVTRLLSEGSWSFELPLTEAGGEVELLSAPVVCEAQSGGEGKPRAPTSIQVDSFVLRPFGATCRYSLLPGIRPDSVDILDVYLLLRDGSTVAARPNSGGGGVQEGFVSGTMTYLFDSPVLLEEVECLVLPGGLRLPMPEAAVTSSP